MLTILLDQTAIEEALANYIGETTLGVDLSNKDVSIKLTAGRGDNGHRAEITISSRPTSGPVAPENDVDDSADTSADEPCPTEEAAIGLFD